VQRTDTDPLVFDVIYQGQHTCKQTAHTTNKNKPLSVLLDPLNPELSEMVSAEDTVESNIDHIQFEDEYPFDV
jgi:hypothetical protein